MLADRYDAFLFDLDGVLYRGEQPITWAAETLETLRAHGKRLAFVTNNSSRTPQAVAERLRRVGVAADDDEVVTSALVTADLLEQRGVRSAFVVGGAGLREAIAARGIALAEASPGGTDGGEGSATRAVPDVVVVGFDPSVSYDELRDASILVQRGASLIGSNPDASFPAADGWLWPGAGALLSVIETTTGVRAEVVGKPGAPLLRAALARAGGGVPLLVGDRLDTDIAGALALGWDAALVLSGVSTREDAATSAAPPTYVIEDLRGLLTDAG